MEARNKYMREYMKEYREKNRERINEQRRKWRARNPEKQQQYNENYWKKKETERLEELEESKQST